MVDNSRPLKVMGTLDYESGRQHRGGGQFDHGHALRKGDGFVQVDSLELYLGSDQSDRGLKLEISEPLKLPDLVAELALAEPNGEEKSADFLRRLEFRDDLATAFENAASRLRKHARS